MHYYQLYFSAKDDINQSFDMLPTGDNTASVIAFVISISDIHYWFTWDIIREQFQLSIRIFYNADFFTVINLFKKINLIVIFSVWSAMHKMLCNMLVYYPHLLYSQLQTPVKSPMPTIITRLEVNSRTP